MVAREPFQISMRTVAIAEDFGVEKDRVIPFPELRGHRFKALFPAALVDE